MNPKLFSNSELKSAGFTLVELIFVILIMGILAVSVIPKWTGTSLGVEFEARRLVNVIRYTQALSVATGQRYRWVKVSSSSYSILNQSGTAIILPSGGTILTLSNNVSIGSLSNLPDSLVAFDSQGVPYTTSSTPGTTLGSTAGIPMTSSGGQTRTVQITPSTGYVGLA